MLELKESRTKRATVCYCIARKWSSMSSKPNTRKRAGIPRVGVIKESTIVNFFSELLVNRASNSRARINTCKHFEKSGEAWFVDVVERKTSRCSLHIIQTNKNRYVWSRIQ